MPTVHFTDSEGATRDIDAKVGDSVMETAVRNGVPGIVAESDLDGLDPMSEMEDEMLWGTTEDREDNSRLSCQLKITDDTDLHVTTPETQV